MHKLLLVTLLIFCFAAQAGNGWVINEFQADPDSSLGDANGDGDADTTEDEFVEFINNSGSDVDITEWSLGDAIQERHIFPPHTVVPNGCAMVVFGGGTPSGTFGDSTVQTANSGGLGLNNSGDTIYLRDELGNVIASHSYGSEAGDNTSVTRNPDLSGPFEKHDDINGMRFSPGTRIDGSKIDPSCQIIPPPPLPATAEIFEIQGPYSFSAFDGASVETQNNVVTAVGLEGFFIQTPDARDDNDPTTSNAIYVFTGSPPTVAVGDDVTVQGTVEEYFGFTEFGFGSIVTINNSGATLPNLTFLDHQLPSPDPDSPSCPRELECLEGMLVQIDNGVAASSHQQFGGDDFAEFFATASGNRAMREPGIEYPGLGGTIPTFDGNPEVFEVDVDKLGLPNTEVTGGSRFQATGVLAYEFGGWEVWATDFSVTDANAAPRSVRATAPEEITVGSYNLHRLFDNVDDPVFDDPDDITAQEYADMLSKHARYIVDVLNAPHILAVQEAEKQDVLIDLAATINSLDNSINYTAYLEDSVHISGIDVGFLVQETITPVLDTTVLGADETQTLNGALLHDRPPYLLETSITTPQRGAAPQLAVLAVHMRSLGGIDSDSDGQRVREKRLEQAQSVGTMINDYRTNNPGVPLIVIGDFNAFQFTDGYVDLMGQVRGKIIADENLLSETPITSPPMRLSTFYLPAEERYSFLFGNNAQALDHAIFNDAASLMFNGVEYGRGNIDTAEFYESLAITEARASDHDGLVLYLNPSSDRIFWDRFEE